MEENKEKTDQERIKDLEDRLQQHAELFALLTKLVTDNQALIKQIKEKQDNPFKI